MKIFGWGRSSTEHKAIKSPTTLREWAWKAFAADDFSAALVRFQELTALEPNSAAAWFGYAWSKFRASCDLGLPEDEVLAQFGSAAEKSLKLNDSSRELEPHQVAGAHLLLGFINSFSGKRKTAMAHFQSAIDVAPENPISVQARLELASRSLEDGDVATAELLLREASRLAPEDPKVSAGMELLEQRRGRLRVRFQVIQLGGVPKGEHIEVLAAPDETLGDIATREFPKYGLNTTGIRFIYSGDNALPSDLDFGNRERHETLRQIGLKDGDSVFCMILVSSHTEEESYDVRLIRDHLNQGHPALARREMLRVIARANRDLDMGELESVESTAKQLAKLLPDRLEPATLLDRACSAIRERDTGSASTPARSWFHVHGSPSRTGYAASLPAPPLEQLWEFRPPAGTLTTPVVHLDNVFTGCSDRYLYSLDAYTGMERWRSDARVAFEQPPAAIATALYVPDGQSLTSLDVKTGKVIWQRDYAHTCSPAILDGGIFIANREGYLYRLDPASGKATASFKVGIPNLHSIALDGARVVALSNSCAVCVDPALQRIVWTREGAFGETTPVLAWNRVYLGTQKEGLWCVDANTGLLSWVFATEAPVKAAPSAAKGRIFFGDSGGRFGSLDAWTGSLLWRPKEWLTNEIACSTSPVVADSFVYVLLDNGALYCLETLSGSEVWSGFAFEAEGGLAALAATSDAVYATSRLGALVCFGTQDLAKRAGVLNRKAVSVPPRTNMSPLRSNTETTTETIQMLDFRRPTRLSRKETNDLHQAIFFSMNNRLDEATAILQRLQHEHPDELIVLYNLGNAYEWQGLVGEALTVFDHILELEPGDAYAFSAIGRLLRTHPELITDIFGDAPHVVLEASRKPAWIAGKHIIPLMNRGNAVAGCRIDVPLVSALSTGPVWYSWQMVQTDHGPVVRLYLEFNYQPYKFHSVVEPLNIVDPPVNDWLAQLERQDSFIIACFDENGGFRFARQLSHSVEQRERLRNLRQRALMAMKAEPAIQDFEAAIREAEERWEQRLKPGRHDLNEERHE